MRECTMRADTRQIGRQHLGAIASNSSTILSERTPRRESRGTDLGRRVVQNAFPRSTISGVLVHLNPKP